MPHVSRRGFLATSAAAPFLNAAPRPAPAAAPRRNLLVTAWPAESLAAALTPRERFQPFAPASNRPAWEALPADARAALVHSGERQLKAPWEILPATLILEFTRNGNRSRSDSLHDRRRRKLLDLVLAECAEAKGRFIDEIVNGVWLTCEESFWGSVAHLSAQRAGFGLPDVAEPIVELFAGETASLLAWTAYLLGPSLAAVSERVPERIHLEIDRRILTPCLARDNFGWMGFSGQKLNNWTPWICSNWLTAALLQEFDEKRRLAAVAKILRCLDNFLEGYADDGGCDEGPSYWGRAGAALFDCLELLGSATSDGAGAEAAFRQPLVHEMGRYICRAHIYDDWYTNFADAPARVRPDGDLIYRYGKRVADSQMMAHGAFAAFQGDAAGLPGDSLSRQLPALFHLAELRQAPRAQALSRDVWLPGIQVMAARVKEGSAEGLYLAAQGGHNAESHNHNDVGNFMVYANGQPAIVDVGVETYTAKTFSPQRYEIWTMQSAYHNCPTIDGFMQSTGRRFAASEVVYRADDAAAEFKLNLVNAYPKEANLRAWNRALRLLRGENRIELVDAYSLKQPAKQITLTLMTPCAVKTETRGQLLLGDAVKVFYDAAALTPVVEEIKIEDPRLRGTWGDRLYRVLLRAENPPLEGAWTTRIAAAR